MKRFKGDPKYTKIAVYVVFTITILLIVNKLIGASENLWDSVREFFRFIFKAIKPIVWGMILAYILLPGVEGLEKGLSKIFRKDKLKKLCKGLSLFLIYLLLFALIIAGVYLIIPSVGENIVELVKNAPDYSKTVEEWYLKEVATSEILNNDFIQNAIQDGLDTIDENINDYLAKGIAGIATFTFSVITGIITALLSIIISFYLISGRKKLAHEIVSTSNAYIGEKRTTSIRSFLKAVDWVFGKYISAKIIEIIIVFVMCQIAFLLLGVPYSTLMALIVAITNIVPFIGPIIGLVPPVIVTLLESPIQSLWVLGAVLVIQAIDAYLIQPYFIGDKMGLSPFWVLVSVIIGGGLFGVWGILLSVPVAAVIRILIKQYARRRNRKAKVEKQVSEEKQKHKE
jgi:predicted PurR-regulated permease PerM